VACAADDPQLAPIVEASRGIDISAGFVGAIGRREAAHRAGHWSGGKLVQCSPEGLPADLRHLRRWSLLRARRSLRHVQLGGCTTGVAICEDLWHVSTPYLYAAAGATIVLAPSASPGRGVAEGGDLGTAESCRLMDRFYASYLTVYVVYVNRVATRTASRSGALGDRRPRWDSRRAGAGVRRDLLIGEIDPELVARERARNPLLRDEREDIV